MQDVPGMLLDGGWKYQFNLKSTHKLTRHEESVHYYYQQCHDTSRHPSMGASWHAMARHGAAMTRP